MKLHILSNEQGGSFILEGSERKIMVLPSGMIPDSVNPDELTSLDACLIGSVQKRNNLWKLQEAGFLGVLILSRKLWEQSETPPAQVVLLEEKKSWRNDRLLVRLGENGYNDSLWFSVEIEDRQCFFSGRLPESTPEIEQLRFQEGDLAVLDQGAAGNFLSRSRFEKALIVPTGELIELGSKSRIRWDNKKPLEF